MQIFKLIGKKKGNFHPHGHLTWGTEESIKVWPVILPMCIFCLCFTGSMLLNKFRTLLPENVKSACCSSHRASSFFSSSSSHSKADWIDATAGAVIFHIIFHDTQIWINTLWILITDFQPKSNLSLSVLPYTRAENRFSPNWFRSGKLPSVRSVSCRHAFGARGWISAFQCKLWNTNPSIALLEVLLLINLPACLSSPVVKA